MENSPEQNPKTTFYKLDTDFNKKSQVSLKPLDDQHINKLKGLNTSKLLDAELEGKGTLQSYLASIAHVTISNQNFNGLNSQMKKISQEYNNSLSQYDQFKNAYRDQLLSLQNFDNEILQIYQNQNGHMNEKFQKFREEQQNFTQYVNQAISDLRKTDLSDQNFPQNNQDTNLHIKQLKIENDNMKKEIEKIQKVLVKFFKTTNQELKNSSQEMTQTFMDPSEDSQNENQQQTQKNLIQNPQKYISQSNKKGTQPQEIQQKNFRKSQNLQIKDEDSIDNQYDQLVQQHKIYHQENQQPIDQNKDKISVQKTIRINKGQKNLNNNEEQKHVATPKVFTNNKNKVDSNQQNYNLAEKGQDDYSDEAILNELKKLQENMNFYRSQNRQKEQRIAEDFNRLNKKINKIPTRIQSGDGMNQMANDRIKRILTDIDTLQESKKNHDLTFQEVQEKVVSQNNQIHKINETSQDVLDVIKKNNLENYIEQKRSQDDIITQIAFKVGICENKFLDYLAYIEERVHKKDFEKLSNDVEYNVLMMRNLQNSQIFQDFSGLQDKINKMEKQFKIWMNQDKNDSNKNANPGQFTKTSHPQNMDNFLMKTEYQKDLFRINDQIKDLKTINENIENNVKNLHKYIPLIENTFEKLKIIQQQFDDFNFQDEFKKFQQRIKFELDFLETNLRKQIEDISQSLKDISKQKKQINTSTQTLQLQDQNKKNAIDQQQLIEIKNDIKDLSQNIIVQIEQIFDHLQEKVTMKDLMELDDSKYFNIENQKKLDKNMDIIKNKFQEKQDSKKFFDTRLNELGNVLLSKQDVQMDALLTKKALNWACISCDSDLDKLKGEVQYRKDWAIFPPKDTLPERYMKYGYINLYEQEKKYMNQSEKKDRLMSQKSVIHAKDVKSDPNDSKFLNHSRGSSAIKNVKEFNEYKQF